MKKYSIVIPTYNHCNDFLKPCIESIFNYSNMDEVEICVAANGCTDNTLEYLTNTYNQYPNIIRWHWSKEPLGYARATNQGIKIAEGEYVVLLNNDTTILPHNKNEWLERLRLPFEQDIDIGITGILLEHSEILKREFLIFLCVMMRRSLFKEIGFLDEDFKVGGCEDMEYCYRALCNGYKLKSVTQQRHDHERHIIVTDYPLWHLGEGTAHDKSLVTVDLKENDQNNKKLLREKISKSVIKESNKPKIVLKHTYGGLGDNLVHSTLPEIYSKKGYDVYVSIDQEYRNLDVKYLIDMNPYIKGHTARKHNLNVDQYLNNTYPRNYPNKNYQARIELAVFGEIFNQYPKIYYTPIFLPEWSDKTVIDLTSVSYQQPQEFFLDYALKNNENCVRIKYDYTTKNIFEFINIIYSCKKFICVYTGSMVLAAAINKRNTDCYMTEDWMNVLESAYFYHYDNINYVCVDNFNRSLINVE